MLKLKISRYQTSLAYCNKENETGTPANPLW